MAYNGSASAEMTEEGRPVGKKRARRNLHEDEQHKELMAYLVSSDAKSQAYQQDLKTVCEAGQLRQS